LPSPSSPSVAVDGVDEFGAAVLLPLLPVERAGEGVVVGAVGLAEARRGARRVRARRGGARWSTGRRARVRGRGQRRAQKGVGRERRRCARGLQEARREGRKKVGNFKKFRAAHTTFRVARATALAPNTTIFEIDRRGNPFASRSCVLYRRALRDVAHSYYAPRYLNRLQLWRDDAILWFWGVIFVRSDSVTTQNSRLSRSRRARAPYRRLRTGVA